MLGVDPQEKVYIFTLPPLTDHGGCPTCSLGAALPAVPYDHQRVSLRGRHSPKRSPQCFSPSFTVVLACNEWVCSSGSRLVPQMHSFEVPDPTQWVPQLHSLTCS